MWTNNHIRRRNKITDKLIVDSKVHELSDIYIYVYTEHIYIIHEITKQDIYNNI